ncbi:MAG: polysaccharide export protein [Myxococcales bacterium]|nr:polysaccharide export protein [Myxococcales bacterium]
MPAIRCTLAILILILAGSCGDPPPSEYPTQEVYLEDTTLGAGDIFDVRVFQHEEMSATYSTSAEGTISFPLIGTVPVSGKTPSQLEQEILVRLADGFIVNPQVSVLVKEYKSKKLSVFGQVKKPGTLGFTEGMTIIEAISRAGGFTPMARKNAVTVTRETDGKQAKYTVPVDTIGRGKASNFYVRPGDVVFVPERLF